ncbi:MAG: hypothetical protein AAF108_02385 [Planctomycetota bacterium]
MAADASANPAFYSLPDDGGEIVAVHDGGNGPVWGRSFLGNPLVEPPPVEGRTVCWSGWFDDDETGVRTWSDAGWSAFRAWLTGALPRARDAGGTVVVRPRATHVLSDPQRCYAILEEFDEPAMGVLLDPVGMLAPSMLGFAEDHLRRAFGAIGRHPRLAGVVLSGAWLGTGETRVKPTSLLMDRADGGRVNARDVVSLYAELTPPGTPVFLVGPGASVQAARVVELLGEVNC